MASPWRQRLSACAAPSPLGDVTSPATRGGGGRAEVGRRTPGLRAPPQLLQVGVRGGHRGGAGVKGAGGHVPLCVGPARSLWRSGPPLGGGSCPVSPRLPRPVYFTALLPSPCHWSPTTSPVALCDPRGCASPPLFPPSSSPILITVVLFIIIKSSNHQGWKRPSRSSSPTIHLPPIFPH